MTEFIIWSVSHQSWRSKDGYTNDRAKAERWATESDASAALSDDEAVWRY
jgi:hypothetical protein